METNEQPRRMSRVWLPLAPVATLALIGGGVALVGPNLAGCAALEKLAGKVNPPGVALNRVDLVDSPSMTNIGKYACHEWVDPTGFTCPGSKPSNSKMLFSFDVVFDVENKNEKLPIPLVEVLMGIEVYDGEDLGAVCISFCDPDDEGEDCTATTNAEDACNVDDAKEVDHPIDLVPSGNDIRGLAEAAIEGDFDNNEFRVINAGETIEAHIQFDLEIGTMISLSKSAFISAITSGSVRVPYSVEGNVFFDVPELGRYAFGFGPFEEAWNL